MSVYDLIPPIEMQFFYPTDEFMVWWRGFVNGRLVYDLGAGICEFTKAMHRELITAIAIEPRANDQVRRECVSFLFNTDVQSAWILDHTPVVAVAARPDHSGWVSLVPYLLHPESEFIYIGLPNNFDTDLDGLVTETLFKGAGEDGEHVLRVTR